eukprot:tig00001388_g8577.t1
MEYLREKNIEALFSRIVNRLAAQKPDDVAAFVVRELAGTPLALPPKVSDVTAREILDCRGHPAVEVEVEVEHLGLRRVLGRASAAGAHACGANEFECVELRDGEPTRMGGRGVQKAVANVREHLRPLVLGRDPSRQAEVDAALRLSDETPNKAEQGANAIASVSMAVAEAGAAAAGVPLFRHLSALFSSEPPKQLRMPRPVAAVIAGGPRAGANKLKAQQVCVVPRTCGSFRQALEMVLAVREHLGKNLAASQAALGQNTAVTGALAPAVSTLDEACTLVEKAIDECGLKGQLDLAVDIAAHDLQNKDTGLYDVPDLPPGKPAAGVDLCTYYTAILDKHPSIIMLEDPFSPNDVEAWKKAKELLGPRVLLCSDRATSTRASRVEQAASDGWAPSAVCVKLAQAGTVWEAFAAAREARAAGAKLVVSHRAGETNGAFLADLAVALGAPYAKIGAPVRGERVAKYNRLLAIEEALEAAGALQPMAEEPLPRPPEPAAAAAAAAANAKRPASKEGTRKA